MKNVEEILHSLTLQEKASLCQGASFWFTRDIEEKGVPAIMVTDGPNGLRKQTGETDHLGVNKSVPATCFPTSASLCNSWDAALVRRVGEALGEECLAEQVSVLLGPGANIKRSPLCGRNFEYFSEDPYLSSQMAKNYICGVQSKGVGTSLKHFAVNNQETRRMTVNAVVDERTLREIYLASFEAAVREAKPWTIMAAYNKVNGTYCCENHHLLKEVLRKEWGYEGVVVSDWGAANDQTAGIQEGFDLRMPYAGAQMDEKIVNAVEEGRLPVADLDAAVRRILTLVKKGVENRKEGASFDREAHHRLAVQAAEESAVLLKNEGDILPLSESDSIAVIGAFARFVRYQGGGSSHVNPTQQQNILDVLSAWYPDKKFQYARGYRLKIDRPDPAYEAEALCAAKSADKILLFLGLPDGKESEGFDRKDMQIPQNQIALLQKLAALGKPIVGVLFAGSPVEMPWADSLDALLDLYLGGQGAAEAAVRLLFGKANPSGKLAETFPLRVEHTPCSLTYPQKETAIYQEGIFVGYRYYDTKKLPVRYAFGHGLSYTKWEYSDLHVDRTELSDQDELTVSLRVKNVGTRTGSEIVQLYVGDLECSVPRPLKELKGFQRVTCRPKEQAEVTFTLNKRSFAWYNTEISDWYVETGKFSIQVGAASDDIRLSTVITVNSTTVIDKTYDAYVTMGELMTIPAAQPILAKMTQGVTPMSEEERQRLLEDEDSQQEIAMDYAAMGMDMPLIKVADMSGGAFTEKDVAGIVALLNQKHGS